MVKTESRLPPGTDEDQREGASELGVKARAEPVAVSVTIISKHGLATGYQPSGPICWPYPQNHTAGT
jgi:hypothetical protein